MTKVIVIASGTPPKLELLAEYSKGGYLICADGGANHLFPLKITPDEIIGDLDSISSESLELAKKSNCSIKEHPIDKDLTDFELALIRAVELSASNVVVIAGLGGRTDHALGNLLVATDKRFERVHLQFIEEDGEMTLHLLRPGIEYSFHTSQEDLFSVIPVSTDSVEISLDGARWNLSKARIKLGSTRCISNRCDGEILRVHIQGGCAYLRIGRLSKLDHQ